MERRDFLFGLGSVAAASIAAAETLDKKADLLEEHMSQALDDGRLVATPWACDAGHPISEKAPVPGPPYLMGDDPRLPGMPARPTLVDFFNLRFRSRHLLQSANLALKNGVDEKIVLACLLHDISVKCLIRTDHGYWASQLVEPYVDPEIAWAIRYHQALRFYPDPAVHYEYPKAYRLFFGEEYKPAPYIEAAYQAARAHKWYMSARLITLNDLYAFDPSVTVTLDPFIDIIGRHFRQPPEGLGFDGSPVAHMWRSIIWPANFL